jgi:tetratricopeptide (TPR) repeat protein
MNRLAILLISAFTILVSSTQLYSQGVESRRAQLIGVIDEELREVARINKQSGSRNPELMLRMAELLLEKARLVKEQENTKFLDLSPDARKKVNRDRFFTRSKAYFKQAQKTTEYIIKRFRNFDEKGDVYYIMAYNAKEFQQEKKARRYFDLAVQNSRPGTMTRKRSQIALAEIYYNNNEYARAVPLYERALLNSDEKERWWTKDAYNLAWSYFRQQDYDKAINMLERVEKLSANKKLIDMRDSVERDKAYFYTEAGRTDEAVAMFKKGGGDIANNLLKVGKNLVNQGKFAAAAKSLEEALRNTNKPEQKTAINIELISLYERFGQPSKHLRTSQALFEDYKNKRLNPEQAKVLSYQIGRMGALLQKQATSNTYDSRPKVKQEKGRHAVSYFEMMAEMDPKTAHRSTFHAGETSFAIGDANNALVKYDAAVELAKKNNDKKTYDLALQGMMMALDSKNLSPAVEKRYLEKAFRLHLAGNSGKKSNSKEV